MRVDELPEILGKKKGARLVQTNPAPGREGKGDLVARRAGEQRCAIGRVGSVAARSILLRADLGRPQTPNVDALGHHLPDHLTRGRQAVVHVHSPNVLHVGQRIAYTAVPDHRDGRNFRQSRRPRIRLRVSNRCDMNGLSTKQKNGVFL